MANVAHKNLTGVDLHEPKGAATAASGKIYVADGAGSGAWTAQTVPGIVLISTVLIPSAVAQVDFVNGAVPTNGTGTVTFDDTYDSYEFRLSNLKVDTNDVELWVRVGTGGTPTYQTSGYLAFSGGYYTDGGFYSQFNTTNRIIYAGGSAAATALGNTAGKHLSGILCFNNPEVTSDTMNFHGKGIFNAAYASAACPFTCGGIYNVSGAITAIRWLSESGNITSGRISLYGYKKA